MVSREQLHYLKALLSDPAMGSEQWRVDFPPPGARVVHISTGGASIVVGGYVGEVLPLANALVALRNQITPELVDFLSDCLEESEALAVPHG